MTLRELETARPALLALQATLLEVERRERERVTGRLPTGAWYAAILEDPALAWLRPFGQLVAELDAAMDDAVRQETPLTPEAVEAFAARVRACLVPGTRYLELLQEYPEVVFAHRDARTALAPAPAPAPKEPGSGSEDGTA